MHSTGHPILHVLLGNYASVEWLRNMRDEAELHIRGSWKFDIFWTFWVPHFLQLAVAQALSIQKKTVGHSQQRTLCSEL